MPVFIELTTDAFATAFEARNEEAKQARRAGTTRARRPLRGLEIKDDTYAFLKIVRSDGSEIKLVDSSSPDGESTQYSNFILQSVSEARMEKHQIIDTFGEPYIYFFGESPRFLDVTAVLVDSLDFNWYAEFWENYNKYFRGTRSVELGARTYLFYDDNVVEGYVLNAQAQKMADLPLQARLSFRLYLTNYSNVTFVGDPNYPVRASVNLPPSVNLTTADAFTVGLAALGAETDAALQESRAIQAAAGARQQASGFGGGKKLSDSLRGGTSATGDPFTDGLLLNAFRALGNAGDRTQPLRGLIADNFDEFTALLPPPPEQSEQERAEQDHDGQPEAESLPAKSTSEASKYGANINSPNMYARLGMGPRFTAQAGFGVFGGATAQASFGVGGGASFNASFRGGVNGGLGFTGGFSASANLRATAGVSISARANATASIAAGAAGLAQTNLSRQFGASIYGNGVLINGGIVQGTGVGGGVPLGVSGGIGPNGPGTLRQFTGGRGYSSPTGFGSSQGYGAGLWGNGAVLNVPGAPSAFATVAAPGTLFPFGNATFTPPRDATFGVYDPESGLYVDPVTGFPVNQPYGNPFGAPPSVLPGQAPFGQPFGGAPPLGTATGTLFIGPDGVSSQTNTTGIFV